MGAEVSNDVFKQLKLLMYEFVDERGNMTDEVKYNLLDRTSSKEKVRLLKDICTFILNTDYLSDSSKYYVKFKNYRVADIVDRQFEQGKRMSENAVRQIIFRDKQRYRKDLPDLYSNLVILKSGDIKEYEKMYFRLLERYGSECTVREKISLDLDCRKDEVCRELSEEKFVSLIEILRPHILINENKLVENMDKDMIGYFNYLIEYHSLDEIDSRRLRVLIDLIENGK
ncbi:MAG: hypothetical protein RR192_04250 [Peptostreptococcaceae bacterium]